MKKLFLLLIMPITMNAQQNLMHLNQTLHMLKSHAQPQPHPSPPPPSGTQEAPSPGTPAGGSSSGWTVLTQAKYDAIVAGMPAGTGMIAQGQQRLYVAQQLKGITESSEVQAIVREAMLAGTSYADFKAANPNLFKEGASSTAGPTPGSPPPPPGSTTDGSSFPSDKVPTEKQYKQYKTMLSRGLPAPAVANKAKKNNMSLSLDEADQIIAAVKDSSDYADFKTKLASASGTAGPTPGHHAPPTPPKAKKLTPQQEKNVLDHFKGELPTRRAIMEYMNEQNYLTGSREKVSQINAAKAIEQKLKSKHASSQAGSAPKTPWTTTNIKDKYDELVAYIKANPQAKTFEDRPIKQGLLLKVAAEIRAAKKSKSTMSSFNSLYGSSTTIDKILILKDIAMNHIDGDYRDDKIQQNDFAVEVNDSEEEEDEEDSDSDSDW